MPRGLPPHLGPRQHVPLRFFCRSFQGRSYLDATRHDCPAIGSPPKLRWRLAVADALAPTLGRLERVDARHGWRNEERDFTPWLQQNIEQLGEALGMDIQVQAREV